MKSFFRIVAPVLMIVAVSFLTVKGLPAAGTGSITPASKANAATTPKVEIYITDWCPYCVKAIKFLKANKIAYKAYNVDTDSAAEERRAKLSGRSGVPFAVINGKKILGYSEDMYKEALGLK